MNKRGQGYQLNWVFVVFAGAIILFFFVAFGMRYMNFKETQNNAEIALGLNNMVSGLKTTTLYKNYSTSYPFDLNFSCNSIIVNNDFKLDFDNKIIFMNNMKVDNIIVWTDSFEYPFLVDNLVYFVDMDKDYYLINGGTELYNELPDSIKNKFHLVSSVSSNDQGVFVFFSIPTNVDSLKERGKVLSVYNDKITFYEERNKEIDYRTNAMLFGAIFANNYNNYKCGYDLLKTKFGNIVTIYKYKISYLVGNSCNYQNVLGYLNADSLWNNPSSVISLKEENRYLSDIDCEAVF